MGSTSVKLLLDTHIWLWYQLGDDRLSLQLQSAIADSSTELWLSPISIWETLLLAEKKRISLKPEARIWIGLALNNLETREATLNHDIPPDRVTASRPCRSLHRCFSYFL